MKGTENTQIDLDNKDLGILWNILEKYESKLPELSDSINKVILKKYSDEDIMTISQSMDYRDIDFEDSILLDKILGCVIGLVCFSF